MVSVASSIMTNITTLSSSGLPVKLIFQYYFWIWDLVFVVCLNLLQLTCNIFQNRDNHGLLNTRSYMSHVKAKIKRPVFQKNSTK